MQTSDTNDRLFYVTTPIYYANGKPHIGNAYTSFIADLYARTKRMCGYTVKFATGTDENGQKMTQKAAEHGKDVMEFLDDVALLHKSTWDGCRISYTDFIRTSDGLVAGFASYNHHAFVQKMLSATYSNTSDTGDHDIYQGAYEGLYCVGCEAFKKEGDLIEHGGKNVCPHHLKEPDLIQEKNWFFRLSRYEERVKELYLDRPSFKKPLFCFPQFRSNEIQSFVQQGLEDFSISREGSDFGVKFPSSIPGAEQSVTYIWFDALYNYLTVCEHTQNPVLVGEGNDRRFWDEGEVLHTLGKDISRFHAIYWPAMLMASDNMPKGDFKELINGFFTVDGQKMSKSLGNVIDPIELIDEHGRDAVVYYLFSDIKIGNDGDFSFERFLSQKESLKKGRGNLVSRVVTLAKKYEVMHVDVSVSDLKEFNEFRVRHGVSSSLQSILNTCNFGVLSSVYLRNNNIDKLFHDRYQLVQLGNEYITKTAPWEKAKTDLAGAKKDLEILLWLIKGIAVLSSPFLIESFEKFQNIMQIDHSDRTLLQTDVNNEGLGVKFENIIALQKFDTKFGESKYLY